MEQDQNTIPESIVQFMQTLLTGDIECTHPSERVKRLTTSLGGDLVFAITGGKIKPPKHLLLPFAVKSLTGNTELIHTVNRLGHSVSYSKVLEVDTALCLQKIERSRNDVPLPATDSSCMAAPEVQTVSSWQWYVTTLVWDNIDRLEETVSGTGTSRRVNGIAVHSKNLVWLLTRMAAPEVQTVSSWTGFNMQIRNDVTVVQDTISYLPRINAPATELSTVFEVLNQTLNIMEYLQLSKIVCVFDHYTQTLQKSCGSMRGSITLSSGWECSTPFAICSPFWEGASRMQG